MNSFDGGIQKSSVKQYIDRAIQRALAEVSSSISLEEYVKIEARLYQDRIFNMQQRKRYKELHFLETNLDYSPIIDVTVVGESYPEPYEKTRITCLKFRSQSINCRLVSVELCSCIEPHSSRRIEVGQNFVESNFLELNIESDTRFPLSISIEILRNNFPHKFHLDYTDEHSSPFVIFETEDYLHIRRNEVREKLSLPEKKNIGDEVWEMVDARVYDTEIKTAAQR